MEGAVSHKTATADEFEVEGDRVVHKPTGAWFSAYKGQPHIAHRSLGHAGELLPNGDDYAPDEVQDVAARLLRMRFRLNAAEVH